MPNRSKAALDQLCFFREGPRRLVCLEEEPSGPRVGAENSIEAKQVVQAQAGSTQSARLTAEVEARRSEEERDVVRVGLETGPERRLSSLELALRFAALEALEALLSRNTARGQSEQESPRRSDEPRTKEGEAVGLGLHHQALRYPPMRGRLRNQLLGLLRLGLGGAALLAAGPVVAQGGTGEETPAPETKTKTEEGSTEESAPAPPPRASIGTGADAVLPAPPAPQVRWSKGRKVLKLRIQPEHGTILAAGSEVVVLLDDGEALRLRWREPVAEESALSPDQRPKPFRLVVPRVGAPGSSTWRVRVTGLVCHADKAQHCAPFRSQGEVPKRGRGERDLQSELLGGGSPPVPDGMER